MLRRKKPWITGADPTSDGARGPGATHRVLEAPEANVVAFAFLLNFPWEIWQMPLFRCLEMFAWSYGEAVAFITIASAGDAAIAVVAFWTVAAATRARGWILGPAPSHVMGFVGVGLAITVVGEWFATRVLNLWQYTEAMPTLPLLGTGLSPLLQWTLIPPLLVWLVRRQLSGAGGRGDLPGIARARRRCRCRACACDAPPRRPHGTQQMEV